MKKRSPHHGRKLFEEPPRPAGVFRARIDGASRGNPGPAAYGAILYKPDGTPIARISKAIGRATNNVAEYYALIAALDYARAHGIRRLRVESDSELLVKQMRGLYRVKDGNLRQLHAKAQESAAALEHFEIEHVARETNAEADALANEALDQAASASKHPAPAARQARKAAPPAPRSGKPVRAHFWDGVLVPEEPLHLADGDKVLLYIEPLPES